MLIDVETRRPIDLLPDRSADTVAAWLADHPEIKVICRDRCSTFSQAAARAAPDAIEVADRWHLLHAATALTQPVWPVRGWPTCPPVAGSHTRTVPSPPPLASKVGIAAGTVE
ncbi:transposase [Streptomyces sp. NPDC049099]|uniref:transposase n=1 Tax=Streptomyces sp. NPDC049099 TaxID=3155768 RepID=UPI00343BA6B1